MSFSYETKLEIIRNADQLSDSGLLKGLVRGSLTLTVEKSATGVQITTDIPEIAIFAMRYLMGTGAELSPEETGGPVNKKVYNLTLKGDSALKLLKKVGVYTDKGEYAGDTVPDLIEDELRAYVAGVFLMTGDVFIPKEDTTGYQLEFDFSSYSYATAFARFLERLGFCGKVIERHDSYVLYIKESETISDLIAYVGAGESVLKLQSLKVLRSVRNKENRISNCEVGNIGKVVAAAQRQINAIIELQNSGKLDTLDDKLKQVAVMRLNNPEEKLDELATRLNISKSCINHRLRKIESIAKGEI